MAKIELTGGHIGFIAIYIDYQNEIGFMLIIEMAKIELIGGHIGFILIIEMAKIE